MPVAVDLMKKYWDRMATNDFKSVGSVLSDDFVLEWPQSGERIRGRDNFVAMNIEYPAFGKWIFTVHRIVGNDVEAVSDVSLTDGTQHARVISFVTVTDGKISKTVEFWPDDFPAPENRKHLVEMM
jgi:ketosteroid isomerase-like protein